MRTNSPDAGDGSSAASLDIDRRTVLIAIPVAGVAAAGCYAGTTLLTDEGGTPTGAGTATTAGTATDSDESVGTTGEQPGDQPVEYGSQGFGELGYGGVIP